MIINKHMITVIRMIIIIHMINDHPHRQTTNTIDGQECTTPSTVADSGPDESSEQVFTVFIITIIIIIITSSIIINIRITIMTTSLHLRVTVATTSFLETFAGHQHGHKLRHI